MVYAIDSQYAAQTFNEVTRRNTLFTAITRSRAWVLIVGWGDRMAPIAAEAATVAANSFELRFAIPTPEKLATLRHIYRVRPAAEEETLRKATEGLETFLEAVEVGEVDLHDLPPALRTRLITRLQREEPVNDD